MVAYSCFLFCSWATGSTKPGGGLAAVAVLCADHEFDSQRQALLAMGERWRTKRQIAQLQRLCVGAGVLHARLGAESPLGECGYTLPCVLCGGCFLRLCVCVSVRLKHTQTHTRTLPRSLALSSFSLYLFLCRFRLAYPP